MDLFSEHFLPEIDVDIGRGVQLMVSTVHSISFFFSVMYFLTYTAADIIKYWATLKKKFFLQILWFCILFLPTQICIIILLELCMSNVRI